MSAGQEARRLVPLDFLISACLPHHFALLGGVRFEGCVRSDAQKVWQAMETARLMVVQSLYGATPSSAPGTVCAGNQV